MVKKTRTLDYSPPRSLVDWPVWTVLTLVAVGFALGYLAAISFVLGR